MDDHVGGPGSSTFINNGSQLQCNEAGLFGGNGHISNPFLVHFSNVSPMFLIIDANFWLK